MMRFFQCSLILFALLFLNLWEPESVLASTDASFQIGSTTFNVNGSVQNMEVCPYVKDGRTFMPILYVAQALGISSDNVKWDGLNNTVTLMKENKIVQLRIGSTTLLVNGAAVNIDANPEISNGRTCLPIGLVAQAFGVTVNYDAATQTIRLSSDSVSNDSATEPIDERAALLKQAEADFVLSDGAELLSNYQPEVDVKAGEVVFYWHFIGNPNGWWRRLIYEHVGPGQWKYIDGYGADMG